MPQIPSKNNIVETARYLTKSIKGDCFVIIKKEKKGRVTKGDENPSREERDTCGLSKTTSYLFSKTTSYLFSKKTTPFLLQGFTLKGYDEKDI